MTNPTDDAVEAVNPDTYDAIERACSAMFDALACGGGGDGIPAFVKALKAEGMVIIPREPTEAMVDAASSGYDSAGYGITDSDAASAYRAMITAHEDE